MLSLAKFVRFSIVGALSGVAYAIVVALCVSLVGIGPGIASMLAYVTVLPMNFVAQRGFTFQSGNVISVDFPKFFIAQILALSICAAAMKFVVNILGLHYGYGIVFSLVLVPLLNFVILGKLVFK